MSELEHPIKCCAKEDGQRAGDTLPMSCAPSVALRILVQLAQRPAGRGRLTHKELLVEIERIAAALERQGS